MTYFYWVWCVMRDVTEFPILFLKEVDLFAMRTQPRRRSVSSFWRDVVNRFGFRRTR